MRIIYWVQCTLREGFCLAWLITDTFLEKCEGGVAMFPKKIQIETICLKLFDEQIMQKSRPWDLGGAIIVFF